MTAARLARVIEKQTGVPQESFALYYGSRPMRGRLKESGVAYGSTIELKFRGRGGGPEPQATSSSEVDIEPPPARVERQSSSEIEIEPAIFGPGSQPRDESSGDTNCSTTEKEMLSGSISAKVVVACKVVAFMFAFSVPCWKVCRHGMLTSTVFRSGTARSWPGRCSLRHGLSRDDSPAELYAPGMRNSL